MQFSRGVDRFTGVWAGFDRGILAGTILSTVLIGAGMLSSGKLGGFLDIPSFFLVFGGTFGATLIHYSIEELGYAWKAFRGVLKISKLDPNARLKYLTRLAYVAKSQGLVSLESESQNVRDSYLRLSLSLVSDSQTPDDIRRILETENRTASIHASKAVQVFETLGTYAPALGLIGTLIGLIQMLGSLENPSTVGPAMALALVTTFYGAILSNMVFIPIAGKLRNRAEEEAIMRALTTEGAVSLARLENSIMIEQRLQSYLPRAA